MTKYLMYLFLFLAVASCTSNTDVNNGELFTVLPEEKTGITFKNRLEESTYLNGFVYEYYYNGAGVATADFNNDGLTDIYFVSNRRANHLYLNKGDLKFENVTEVANTSGSFGFPGGVTVVDINADGLMDIYISKSGRIDELKHLRNELLINQGINKEGIPIFKEMGKEYKLDLPYYSTQASFFDYDQDGDLDMFLINHGIDIYDANQLEKLMEKSSINSGEKLFRNDNGKFIEITDLAGIISSPIGFTLGVSMGDINNDGWTDIYTGNDYSEKDHLYVNNRDGTFTETSLESFGHQSNFSMGTDMADINNDGLIDIISLDMTAQDNFTQKTSMSGMSGSQFNKNVQLGLHHQYMNNALQLNNGVPGEGLPPLFSDVAQITGLSNTDWSWSPLLFDMNNDGLKDVFISNGIKRDFRDKDFNSYHNKKQEDAYRKGTLDKDAYMADLLNKMPTRKKKNIFKINSGELRFTEIDIEQPETASNGAACADFDNDGDIDVVVNNSDDTAFIYRNNTQKKNNYIRIQLKGTQKNKNAIGARVTIVSNKKKQIVERFFTRGFQSASASPIHFGLGSSTAIDTLIVRWPDGALQYDFDIKANQMLTIAYQPTGKFKQESFEFKKQIFTDITEISELSFKHKENLYNDFDLESLIPHKMSQFGPALAVADVNDDGLEDFYIGGAKDQKGILYTQTVGGKFKVLNTIAFDKDAAHEDTGALFIDADNDGDQDLYVVSGGNEAAFNSKYYEDRFYENTGKGIFVKSKNALPKITTSGLKITSGDYDNDGDLDLFVGSRVKPQQYGHYAKSYILENQSKKGRIKFIDKTSTVLPDLVNYKMVTDALWIDYDKDSKLDLVVTSEWGTLDFFKNENQSFVKKESKLGTTSNKGWWFSIAADDLDNDGDIDFIAGNLGLNYKYKASEVKPFYMYLNDFDKNNSEDIVLAYHEAEKIYPLRGRQCSSNQMPFIKEKFKTYEAFAKAELKDVYGDALSQSIAYKATNFASGIFTNSSNSQFRFMPFENTVQISSINKIFIEDFDGDGNKDLILLGNLYTSEVETPRNDASYGHFMKGDGLGHFKVIPAYKSGLYVKGDVKDAKLIRIGTKEKKITALLIAKNDDFLQLIKVNK